MGVMRLEFHQLEHVWSTFGASAGADNGGAGIVGGQRSADADRRVQAEQPDRISNHRRLSANRGAPAAGLDTVEAVVWSLSEVEALLLDRSMRSGDQETALEEGWLLVNWSGASTTGWRNWRGVLIAARVGCRVG